MYYLHFIDYFILFYFILFYFILFYFILFYKKVAGVIENRTQVSKVQIYSFTC